MATNPAIVAALVASPVPPDRECFSNMTQVLQAVQDLVQVNITDPALVPSDGNSIANQALNTANIALATANAASARIPQQRFSAAIIPVPSGDNNFSISWSPSMPDTNYIVGLTLYGPAPTAATFSWYVSTDTPPTVDGCTLFLNNVPVTPGFGIRWSVTSTTPPAS